MNNICLIVYQIEFGRGSEFGGGYKVVAGIVDIAPQATIVSRVKEIERLRNNPKFKDGTLIGFDLPKNLGFYKGKVNVRLIWRSITHPPFIPPERIYRKPLFAQIELEYLKLLITEILWRSPWMKRAIERCDTIFGCNPRDMPPTFTEYSAKIESLNMMARPIEITPQPPPDIDSDVRFLFIERSLDMNETICALETFHVFLQKHPNAHLTIIEKEPRNLQRTSYLEQHFRQRKTQIISWFPQEKLFVSYQHAHVFFFPSMEYQGLLVTEAIQFGFPTLCLKNDGPHSLNRDTSTSVPHQSENKEDTQRALSTELEQLFAIKSREQYQPLQNATQEPYEKNLSVSSQVA